jgi:hypothetical protein
MKTVGRDLAHLDRLIEEGKARARIYRGEPRASRRMAEKDPPHPPQVPTPPSPLPPPMPSFPRLSTAMARFVVASAARARGVDPGDDQPGNPPDPEHGEDGDRDKPKKGPPEPGSLILDAIKRRQEGK